MMQGSEGVISLDQPRPQQQQNLAPERKHSQPVVRSHVLRQVPSSYLFGANHSSVGSHQATERVKTTGIPEEKLHSKWIQSTMLGNEEAKAGRKLPSLHNETYVSYLESTFDFRFLLSASDSRFQYLTDARPTESESLRNKDEKDVFLRGSPGYLEAPGELRNHFVSPVNARSSSVEQAPNREFKYI